MKDEIKLIHLVYIFNKFVYHSGIAGRYQNLELLGPLFHYFDLKTLILNNFISLAADIIF